MNQNYLLGKIVGLIDRRIEKLTPGAMANTASIPQKANVVLRHVWPKAARDTEIGEMISNLDMSQCSAMPKDAMDFWLGYYQTRV